MVFHTARHGRHESLVQRKIEVVVNNHVPEPTIPKEGGEQLDNAGCQRNWPEVGWIGGIICCRAVRDELDGCTLPLSRDDGSISADIKQLDQRREQ